MACMQPKTLAKEPRFNRTRISSAASKAAWLWAERAERAEQYQAERRRAVWEYCARVNHRANWGPAPRAISHPHLRSLMTHFGRQAQMERICWRWPGGPTPNTTDWRSWAGLNVRYLDGRRTFGDTSGDTSGNSRNSRGQQPTMLEVEPED